MDYRMLQVTPISAEDLKDVKLVGKMQTYVVAWVDPSRKASTNLSRQPGKNPKWNETLSLAVEERLLQQPGALLVVEIYHKGFLDSTIVGRVNIPLAEISPKSSGDVPMSYKIRRPSGRFQGTLHISVKIGDKFQGNSSRTEPAMAYPAMGYPQQQGGAYPPPQQGINPPQQGTYPPQQGGYGQPYYPPAYGGQVMPPQPPRRNRFGGGMGGAGLGLGAGLLGGLLVGDLLSHDGYYDDGGYDGDYGGGDFGGDFGGGDW